MKTNNDQLKMLKNTNSLLLASLEASNEGIFAVDANRNLKIYNRKFLEMWNITPAELAGCNEKQIQEICLLKVIDKEKLKSEMRNNYNKSMNIDDEEIKLVDGRTLERTIKLQKLDDVVVGRVLLFRDITDRKLAEEKQRLYHSLLNATLESTVDAILVVNASGQVTQYNRKFVDLWAIPAEVSALNDDEVLLNYVMNQLADPDEFRAKVQDLYRRPEACIDDVVLFADGRCIERHSQPQIFGDKVIGRVWSFRDITERMNIERELANKKSLIDAALESTADGILVVDLKRSVKQYNQKFADMWRIPSELLELNKDEQLLKHMLLQVVDSEDYLTKAIELYKTPSATSLETVILKDGRIIERYSQPQRLDNKVVGRVWSFRDITARKLAEADLVYLSFHDVLTGLYNRRYFEEELLRMDTVRQLPISIISGDVNSLKIINDVFGHSAGDELIATVARIMKDCCRAEDCVVRFGGDEFVVFLPKCDEATAGNILERIKMKCLTETIQGISVSVALGCASKTVPDQELMTVVNTAETRMYKNKFSAVNRVRLDTLEALERTVYEKDNTEEHGERMLVCATGFGEYLKLPIEALFDLTTLATVHDIGKIAVSEQLLNKSGKLSKEEWDELKTHPVMSNRILRATRMVSFNVEEAALAHHEHWDGSGYPSGLKETAIPLLSRIIAIIDAYDVMTHDRPYQTAIPHAAAIEELQRCAGTQFDPELVTKFVEFIGA